VTCPLFVELCAGTAAVSLRLHGGPKARPPVSRMGSKRGYAQAILNACGLRSGQGAGHYLWCEPDPGVRLLLEAYRDPELAREAAAIIRGWKDEEPRAPWERLRAEGPPRGPGPREVARWVWVEGRSLQRHGAGFAGDSALTHKRHRSREAVKAERMALGAAIAAARESAGLSRADVSEAVMGTRSGACWNWEHGQPVSAEVWPALRDLLGLGEWDAVVLAPPEVVKVEIHDAKDWTVSQPGPAQFGERLEMLLGLPATIAPDARPIEPVTGECRPRHDSLDRLSGAGAARPRARQSGTVASPCHPAPSSTSIPRTPRYRR